MERKIIRINESPPPPRDSQGRRLVYVNADALTSSFDDIIEWIGNVFQDCVDILCKGLPCLSNEQHDVITVYKIE